MNQVLTGVGVNRNDRHLFHEHGLCFGEQRIALFSSCSLWRLIKDQVVVDRVAVGELLLPPSVMNRSRKLLAST